MTYQINETHDNSLKSWIESANTPETDFPIQNLPFCIFRRKKTTEFFRIGVVIGNFVFDLDLGKDAELLNSEETEDELDIYSYGDNLNEIFAESEFYNRLLLRQKLQKIFAENADAETRRKVDYCLLKLTDVEFEVPFKIGDYTDFYCSIFHATNVGAMFRPDNPLLPNYKYVPIGYHGRSSSIVVSGTDIKRPHGQNRADAEKPPIYIPCKNLDYEMEVGFFISQGNNLGETISMEKAEEHIFGLCLVNDWSARDIQAWEYQPLGPFLAKNFATSISPFVITMEALAPFRTSAFERPTDDPSPLPHLSSEENKKFGGINLNLEVYLQTQKMRQENVEPFLLSHSNMKDLYWTIGQMLTHHASNGCNLQTGDLIASGTVSGKEKNERGCLLELTWRGTEPLQLPNGETRRFLEDYDEIIMKAFCQRQGFQRIGFGECRGMILPAD